MLFLFLIFFPFFFCCQPDVTILIDRLYPRFWLVKTTIVVLSDTTVMSILQYKSVRLEKKGGLIQ